MDEGELEPAPSEEVEERPRVGFAERDAQARIAAVEIGQDARPARPSVSDWSAEPKRTVPRRPPGEGRHLLGGALGFEQDPAGANGEPRGRPPSVLACAPRARSASRRAPARGPDLLRSAGWATRSRPRRRGEAHRVGDGEEIAEVAELHTISNTYQLNNINILDFLSAGRQILPPEREGDPEEAVMTDRGSHEADGDRRGRGARGRARARTTGRGRGGDSPTNSRRWSSSG